MTEAEALTLLEAKVAHAEACGFGHDTSLLESYVSVGMMRTLLRERARLRAALLNIVAMHEGPPNAVGNWDAAFADCRDALDTANRSAENQLGGPK